MAECSKCRGDGYTCDACGENQTTCLRECECGAEFCAWPNWSPRPSLLGELCYEKHVATCGPARDAAARYRAMDAKIDERREGQ